MNHITKQKSTFLLLFLNLFGKNKTSEEKHLIKEYHSLDGRTLSGEELAAITMTLHLHLKTKHDKESEIITIEMPSAHYSPWAQKHLILRKNPRN